MDRVNLRVRQRPSPQLERSRSRDRDPVAEQRQLRAAAANVGLLGIVCRADHPQRAADLSAAHVHAVLPGAERPEAPHEQPIDSLEFLRGQPLEAVVAQPQRSCGMPRSAMSPDRPSDAFSEADSARFDRRSCAFSEATPAVYFRECYFSEVASRVSVLANTATRRGPRSTASRTALIVSRVRPLCCRDSEPSGSSGVGHVAGLFGDGGVGSTRPGG